MNRFRIISRLSAVLLIALLLGGCTSAGSSSGASFPEESSSRAGSSDVSATADLSSPLQSDTPSSDSSQADSSSVGVSSESSSVPPKDTRILIMSDVHLCSQSWYGISSQKRMEKMVQDLNIYNKVSPYSSILFLGDYSLDFWANPIGGSYLHNKISNTSNLINQYLNRLDVKDYYMIPGNHEQYSKEQWKNITGLDRQFSVCKGGWLFIMLDNYSAFLDPQTDSDGTYTRSDVNFIRSEMAKYPDLPVILCAHYFKRDGESNEFMSLVKNEKRIAALFCGHDHVSTIETLGQEYGNKLLIHSGNYSYTGGTMKVKDCMWGWRVLEFKDNGIDVCYYCPFSTINLNGVWYSNSAGKQAITYIDNPMN